MYEVLAYYLKSRCEEAIDRALEDDLDHLPSLNSELDPLKEFDVVTDELLHSIQVAVAKVPDGPKGRPPAGLKAVLIARFRDLLHTRGIAFVDCHHLSHILIEERKKMLEAYQRNIKQHFLSKYLRRFVHSEMKNLFGEKFLTPSTKKELEVVVSDLKNGTITCETKYRDWLECIRWFLVPKKFEKSYAYDVEKNPMRYLIHMHYINIKLGNNESKLFQVCPQRTSSAARHISITSTAVLELLYEGGNRGNVVRNSSQFENLWESYFKFPRPPTRHHSFGSFIETNGVSVSVLYCDAKSLAAKVEKIRKLRVGRQASIETKNRRRAERQEKAVEEERKRLEEENLTNDQRRELERLYANDRDAYYKLVKTLAKERKKFAKRKRGDDDGGEDEPKKNKKRKTTEKDLKQGMDDGDEETKDEPQKKKRIRLRRVMRLHREFSEEKRREARRKMKEKKRKKRIVEGYRGGAAEFPYIDEVDPSWLSTVNYAVSDNGKRSLFYFGNKDGKKLNITNRRWLHATKRLKYAGKMQRERDRVDPVSGISITDKEKELSRFSSKSCRPDQFRGYWAQKESSRKFLLSKYNDNLKFRKYQFYAYVARQRATAVIVNDIRRTFGKNVVLIMGDASINPSMRHFISTPNITLKRQIGKQLRILYLDEYRTSVINAQTGLYNYKEHWSYIDKTNRKRNVHAVLMYKTFQGTDGQLNRDKNAIANDLDIVQHYLDYTKGKVDSPRPWQFCRDITCDEIKERSVAMNEELDRNLRLFNESQIARRDNQRNFQNPLTSSPSPRNGGDGERRGGYGRPKHGCQVRGQPRESEVN